MGNPGHRKSKDEEMFGAMAAALGAHAGTPRPPRGWWAEKTQIIREHHPEYDEERINRAAGSIWYKRYSPDRRHMAILAEAIKYS